MPILLALALASAQTPDAAAQRLHPDGVDMVIVVPDLPTALEAFGETALARMMKDEDVHSALGEVMGGGPVDPVELLVQGLLDLEGEVPPILDMHRGVRSFSASVDLGDSTLRVIEDLSSFLEGRAAFPRVDVRIVVDFEDDASCEAWTRVMRDVLVGTRSDQVSTRAMDLVGDGGAFGSPRLTVMELPGAMGGAGQYLIHGGTRTLMTVGVEDLDAELARLSQAAPDAYAGQIEAGREKLGTGAARTVVEMFLPAYGGVEVFMDAVDPAGGAAAMLVGPAAALLELMLGAPGTALIRGGHWRLGIGEDGRYLTQGWVSGSSPMASLEMVGGEPLRASSLTLAHPDALVTAVASFDPEELFGLLVQGSTDVSAEGMEDFMESFDAEYGFRIDRDLIEPLGGSVSYSLPKLRSLLSAPNLMAAVSLDDRDTFVRGMDGLMAMMRDAGEVDGQRTDYRGATVYTWSLDALRGGSGGMQVSPLPFDLSSVTRPTVTVMDDRVLLSTLPSHAKREVRRVVKLLKAGEGAKLHAGLSDLGVAEGASMVSFADWPLFYGNLYTQVRALAPMLANLAGGDADLPVPFKLESLPDMDLLTRYFSPSERSWLRVEDGFIDTSTSSIGPEVPAVILGMGLVFSLVLPATFLDLMVEEEGGSEPFEGSTEVEEPPAPPSGPEQQTKADLMSVDVAVRMYQLDHDGQLPPSLEELKKTEPGKPAYVHGALTDGWGRKLRYTLTEEGGYMVWSLGANGADEKGEGDDAQLIWAPPSTTKARSSDDRRG